MNAEEKTDEIKEGLKTIILSNVEVRPTGDIVFKPDGLSNIPRFLKPRVWLKTEGEIRGWLVNELYDAMGVKELDDCKKLIKLALDKAGYKPVDELEVE